MTVIRGLRLGLLYALAVAVAVAVLAFFVLGKAVADWIGLSLVSGLTAAVAFYGAGALLVGLGLKFRAGRTWATVGAWTAALALLVALALSFAFGGTARLAWVCYDGPTFPAMPGLGYALQSLVMFASGVIVAVVGGVVAVVKRQPHIFVTCLIVGAVIPGGFLLGSAQYPSCPPALAPPSPSHQPGQADVTLGEPFPGTNMRGPVVCSRADRGHPVHGVTARRGSDEDNEAWRFHNGHDNWFDFTVEPLAESRLWMRLLIVPGTGPEAISVYTEASGGTVSLSTNADGSQGSLTFTDLVLRDSPVGGGHGLPDKLSGEIHWSCQGEET